MDDRKLLRRYVLERSEAAMSALVERHMRMVYAVARREVGNDSLAEDVTQAVFVILAQKADRLPARIPLASWLFSVTRYAARNARRAERRRENGQQKVVDVMTREMSYAESEAWNAVEPELNTALDALSARECEVILLRYSRDLSMDEVGVALGISAKAAQMRIQRATDKLRALLAARGAPVSLAVLMAVLVNRSADAETTLSAAHVARSALNIVQRLRSGSAGPQDISHSAEQTHEASAQAIARGALKSMTIHTTATASMIVAAVLMGSVGIAATVRMADRRAILENGTTAISQASPAASALFEPASIRLSEVDQQLTVSGGKVHLGEWSAPVRPHMKLTVHAVDGRASVVDEAGVNLWSRSFPSASFPDLVMTVDAQKYATLTDRAGRMVWSGSVAGVQDAGPFVAPDMSSIVPENSGTQNGVFVSEWFFGDRHQVTYRLEHRAGAGHPEGDYAIVKLASAMPGGPDAVIWQGKPERGGIELRSNGQVKVIGISGYPINPTFTAIYDVTWTTGRGIVVDDSAGGKQIASEPITIGNYEDTFTTTMAPDDVRNSHGGVILPGNLLADRDLGHKDYRVTYQNDKAQIVQSEHLILDVASQLTPGPDPRRYRQVHELTDDRYDEHGKLIASMPDHSYVLPE